MANKKKSGLILSCWIVATLILLIAILVNANTVIANLKATNFFERVFGTTPEFIKNHNNDEILESNNLLKIEIEDETKEETLVENDTLKKLEQENIIENFYEKETEGTVGSVSTVKEKTEENSSPKTEDPIKNLETQVETTESKNSPATKPAPVAKEINLSLFFVKIESDGSITRKEIVKPSLRRDAPLTAALELLLTGPQESDKCMTLIPTSTRLLGASIKNNIAYLNLSEEFEFNSYGVEGYLGQLMQIVFTATAFSSVNSVQFLIEGQKKDYLGSEGVWIGSPLSRATFK